MKIGITCYPTHGGSGVVATELGKLMADRGHLVHFVTDHIPFRLGKFHRNIFYHKVEVNDYPVFRYPPYDLALASRLAQVIKTFDLDVLHVHYALPHAVAAYMAKQMVGDRVKIVTTLHGTDITVLGHDASLRDLIRFIIEKSDYVTAVSNNLIEETKKLIAPNKHIELVYNFVDPKQYFPRPKGDIRHTFADSDEKILIHISNFRPVKRTKDVIDIFYRVHQKVRSKLLLVGDGPDWCSVREKVERLGLTEHVHFLGKLDDVSEVVCASDVMLLPSEYESFGLVALEAMSCGVPTVATNVGGVPEVILHGKTGFLAEVGDIEKMAEYSIQILQNDILKEQLTAQCIQRANEAFHYDEITDQYERIYRNVFRTSVSGLGLS